jgi:hypothetical protein
MRLLSFAVVFLPHQNVPYRKGSSFVRDDDDHVTNPPSFLDSVPLQDVLTSLIGDNKFDIPKLELTRGGLDE